MNNARTIVVCVVIAAVSAALGFGMARHMVQRQWEDERSDQNAEIQKMSAELDRLKDIVRKTRAAGNELRAKVNPLTTRPKAKADHLPPPPWALPKNRRPPAGPPSTSSAPVPPLRWQDEQPKAGQ